MLHPVGEENVDASKYAGPCPADHLCVLGMIVMHAVSVRPVTPVWVGPSDGNSEEPRKRNRSFVENRFLMSETSRYFSLGTDPDSISFTYDKAY